MKISSNLLLASDHHFNHNRTFIYAARGFASAEEHDIALIDKHNQVVKPDDTVLFLGDTFLGNPNDLLPLARQLNGKIHYMCGNHITAAKQILLNEIGWIPEPEVFVAYYHQIELAFSHFPLDVRESRSGDHAGLQNIHGHTHGTDIYYRPYSYNVSIDALPNYEPIRLGDLIDGANTKYQTT